MDKPLAGRIFSDRIWLTRRVIAYAWVQPVRLIRSRCARGARRCRSLWPAQRTRKRRCRDARMCATQTEDLADRAHRRLHRPARIRAGCAASRGRRLCACAASPISTAATSRTPSPTSTRRSSSRRILRPPTRTAAMPGTRAAITARPSPTTTPPSSSIPIRPRLTSTAPPCGATSATPKARWRIIDKAISLDAAPRQRL